MLWRQSHITYQVLDRLAAHDACYRLHQGMSSCCLPRAQGDCRWGGSADGRLLPQQPTRISGPMQAAHNLCWLS